MGEWLWDIAGMTRDAAMTVVPLLDKEAQDAISSDPDNIDDYKAQVLSLLGIDAPAPAPVTSVQAIVHAYLGGDYAYMSDSECIRIAEGSNPNAFYMWLNHCFDVSGALRKARDVFGECTTQLAYAIAQAGMGVPLSVHLLRMRHCDVSKAPEVPVDFMESDCEVTGADDIVTAYIAAGLAQMYDSDAVGEKLVEYKDRGVARYFPLIVWELEGRSVNPVETTIFDESECLL